MLSQLSPFASLMIGLFLAPPLGLAQPVTDKPIYTGLTRCES